MQPKTISLVVPTHNRMKSLKRLLKSISKLKKKPNEVIIVNDGSKDNTSKYLDKWKSIDHWFLPIVFNNPKSIGPGAARNIGIQLASCDLIGFTDDDCILHSNWISAILNSKFWNNEEIMGIGGKVFPIKKGIISDYFTFHRILEPPRYNQYLVTANACYYKEALELVGGFDENHQYPGGEDNALSFKLAKKGFKFGYEKKMKVWHDYRTSLHSFIQTFYRYGKGCAEIIHKYFGEMSKYCEGLKPLARSNEKKLTDKKRDMMKYIPHRIKPKSEVSL